MKSLLVLIAGIMLFAGVACAENRWGPVVSYWDTADASDGTGFGAVFSFGVSPNVAVDMRYTWYDDLAEGNGMEGASDIDLKIEPIEMGLSFFGDIGSSLRVHIGGGLGYYMIEGNIDAVVGREMTFDPDDEVGLYLVAGFETIVAGNFSEDVLASEVTLFFEVIYRDVSIDEAEVSNTVDRREVIQNGDLAGVGANAGLRFTW